jgi:hypothetical protein
LAFFRKDNKNIAGKYYPGVAPKFTLNSPSDGLGGGANADNTFQSVFTYEFSDPFGRGTTDFVISAGTLPNGFSLNRGSGILGGTYILQGININNQSFNFTVTARDGSPTVPVRTSTSRDYSIILTVPWKFRQVISTSYMCGGYKSGVLWNNVNRCVHATDTTTNLGDNYINNFHYKSGASGYSQVYIWNGGSVTTFNMRNESRTNQGSWNMNGGNSGVIFEPDRNNAWIVGEGTGSTTRRWTFSTQSMTNVNNNGWNSHGACIIGETRGLGWDNGGYTRYMDYATENWAAAGSSAGAHGQQKGMPSKDGKGYGGNQGSYNGGYQFRVTDTSTTNRISIVGKPIGNMGEENYTLGMDHTYCLGTYDGAQNNRSFRFTYATDSGFETGSTTQPKGKGGASSGHCGWRD